MNIKNRIRKNSIKSQYATKEEINKTFKGPGNIIGTVFISLILVGIVIFGLITFAIYKGVSSSFGGSATGGYQEKVKTSDMAVTLKSYDLYEYKSDEYTGYNTPEGYQKIAFLFLIENTGRNNLSSTFGFKVTLTADDYKVESTELKNCSSCETISGNSSYEDLGMIDISSGGKIQGYVGFLVPKNRKILTFDIGDNGFGEHVYIKMDNPAYEEN